MVRDMIIKITLGMFVLVFMSGCVSTTLMKVTAVDYDGNPVSEATVLVDGKSIGQTQNARTRVSNYIAKNTQIAVIKDGYFPVVKNAEKELKLANLVFMPFTLFQSVLWSYGPKSKQTVVMNPGPPGITLEFVLSTIAMANQVADSLEYEHGYELRGITNREVNRLKYAKDTGKTVCGGYSKLFYKMAEEAGYDVYYIGTVDHAYNAILFGDTWYFFDITYHDTERDGKWLWSTEIWNDRSHATRIRVHKLDANYEEFETNHGTTAIGTLKRSSSGKPELIKASSDWEFSQLDWNYYE
ncbi:hypothetical protein FACS189445_4280 [Spirochaetia bacterium]|nr:hypothetical protein FACS189445_4280 [Spirochaetia bacterium]